MNHLWHPTELLHSFESATHEEDAALIVVRWRSHGFKLLGDILGEVVLIVDKIHLHTNRLQSGYLDNKWVVGIVDSDVHTRKANHFVELIAAFVNETVFRHESAHLQTALLHGLW